MIIFYELKSSKTRITDAHPHNNYYAKWNEEDCLENQKEITCIMCSRDDG